MRVVTGLGVLLRERLGLLAGRRVGLISHPAAVLPDLTPCADALRAAGVQLTALFGMEHGFAGAVADGAHVDSVVDERTGVPVFSLYGATREPSAEMLRDVDVLVYDVQDVGVRFYTFISTLFYVLRAAGNHKKPVLILDRPNPINGVVCEGPLVEAGFESFVGIARLPIRHGLTVGELAGLFNAEHRLGAEVAVVPMQGWRRAMWFDETGLSWVPTSPAMPHLSTATVYPGACLVEGTNVSEGRGTALPFEQVGAPWVDPHELVAELNERRLPGVRFRPTAFEPSASKHGGQPCRGVQIHVTERDAFRPVTVGVHLLAALKSRFGPQFAWASYPRADGTPRFHLDALAGGAGLRRALDDGAEPGDIISGWLADEAEWRERRSACLIYS